MIMIVKSKLPKKTKSSRYAKKYKLGQIKKILKVPSHTVQEKQRIIRKQQKHTPGQDMVAFLEGSVRAKLLTILNQHQQILESFIRNLDQFIQSTKDEALFLKPDVSLEWEVAEYESWKMIYRMMDAARKLLIQTREAAKRTLPSTKISLDKKQDVELQTRAKTESLEYDANRKCSSENLLSEMNNEKYLSPSKAIDVTSGTNPSKVSSNGYPNAQFTGELSSRIIHTHRRGHSSTKKPKRVKVRMVRAIPGPKLNTNIALSRDLQTTAIVEDLTYDSQYSNYSNSDKKRRKKLQSSKFERSRRSKKVALSPRNTATVSIAEISDHDIDFNKLQIELQKEITIGEQIIPDMRKARDTRPAISPSFNSVKFHSKVKKRRRDSGNDGSKEIKMLEKKLKTKNITDSDRKRKMEQSQVDKEHFGTIKRLRKVVREDM